MENSKNPHALILPYPAQGHINPMLQFAKRLVSKEIKTTLANTIAINKSMHSDPNSQINIDTYSDGFDEGGSSQAESTEQYLSVLEVIGSQTVTNLVKKYENSDNPFTVIIYDGFLTWALDIAKKFGIFSVVFLTQACSVNSAYYHVQRGLLPVPVKSSTVSLPGLPLFQVSELPSFISNYGSGTNPGFTHALINQFSNIDEADWILCNSFYKLEEEVINWMAKKWKLGSVGPTLPSKYLDNRIENDKDYGISLFKPDSTRCMNWLQSKPKNSVIYVSFGSYAELGTEQMEELALALKATDFYFIWVVRESEKAKLPDNFLEETAEKGLIVYWCPQLEVLAHEAIGCFITHCGFNSVLEALSLGVSIVAMPIWSDQPTNAKLAEEIWGVGIRTRADEKGIVRRESIEVCVREVMEGEKGKEIKENVQKWKNLAKDAIDEGGSSDQNIDEFVAKLRSL